MPKYRKYYYLYKKKNCATIKMTASAKLKHIMPNHKVQSYGLAFIRQNVISYGLNKFEVLYLEIDKEFIIHNMSCERNTQKYCYTMFMQN